MLLQPLLRICKLLLCIILLLRILLLLLLPVLLRVNNILPRYSRPLPLRLTPSVRIANHPVTMVFSCHRRDSQHNYLSPAPHQVSSAYCYEARCVLMRSLHARSPNTHLVMCDHALECLKPDHLRKISEFNVPTTYYEKFKEAILSRSPYFSEEMSAHLLRTVTEAQNRGALVVMSYRHNKFSILHKTRKDQQRPNSWYATSGRAGVLVAAGGEIKCPCNSRHNGGNSI
jgi:hypothetical protein